MARHIKKSRKHKALRAHKVSKGLRRSIALTKKSARNRKRGK